MATLLARDLYLYLQYLWEKRPLFKQRVTYTWLTGSSPHGFENLASSSSGVIAHRMSTKPFGVVLALADTTMDGNWMPLANISWAELSMWGNPEAAGGTVTADFSFVGEPYIPELAIHEVEVFETVEFREYDANDQTFLSQDPAKAGQMKLIWSHANVSYKLIIEKEEVDIDLSTDRTSAVRHSLALTHDRIKHKPRP